MNVLIIGYGSIGKRHAKNLKCLGHAVVLYRSKKSVKSRFKEYYDIDEALQNASAVFITNPTSMHVQTALKVAEKGLPMFIEKPLSHNAENMDVLMKLIRKKNLPVMLGYNMRFHPALKKVKELVDKKAVGKVLTANISVGSYLPDWHPKEDYRNSYSASEALGGGVLLDLSHEIDLARWLFGEAQSVVCFAGKVSSLEIQTEDVAELLLHMKTGAIVEVHLDYLQQPPRRFIEILGSEGTIKWEGKDVHLYYAKTKEWMTFSIDQNKMYVDEVQHFLQCIASGSKPVVNEGDGKAVMNIIMAAKSSSATGKVVRV